MEQQVPPQLTHLEPSPLGTKEYWDNLYSTEITNHVSDPTDVGTIWFDDSSAEEKVLAYLCSDELGLSRKTTSFLDIGTGNGHFLMALRGLRGEEEEDETDEERDGETTNEQFTGRMLGTDYSLKSIELARRLLATSSTSTSPPEIDFLHHDIMASSATPSSSSTNPLLSPPNTSGWDVVLDKGTFDAISLSGETDGDGKRVAEGYKARIAPLVRRGGLFVITSCNWTEGELVDLFAGGEGEFVKAEGKGVAYRAFAFGGGQGQSVSTVAFRRTSQ